MVSGTSTDDAGASGFVVVSGLSCRFGQREMFSGLSFSIEKGDTVGVTGISGCGKSTLLRLIAGLLPRVDVPLAILDGSIVVANSTTKSFLGRGKTGFMFQDATLLPHWSVLENVLLGGRTGGEPSRARARELLARVGLADRAHSFPYELSGGERQRVSMARGFIGLPELLLLDEPFTGLDVANRKMLYGALEELKAASNVTTVFVSHDLTELTHVADSVLVLGRTGNLLASIHRDITPQGEGWIGADGGIVDQAALYVEDLLVQEAHVAGIVRKASND